MVYRFYWYCFHSGSNFPFKLRVLTWHAHAHTRTHARTRSVTWDVFFIRITLIIITRDKLLSICPIQDFIASTFLNISGSISITPSKSPLSLSSPHTFIHVCIYTYMYANKCKNCDQSSAWTSKTRRMIFRSSFFTSCFWCILLAVYCNFHHLATIAIN